MHLKGQAYVACPFFIDFDRLIAEQDIDGSPLREYVWLDNMPVAMLIFEESMGDDDDDDICGKVASGNKGQGLTVAMAETKDIENDSPQGNLLFALFPVFIFIGLLKSRSEKGFIKTGLMLSTLAVGIILSAPLSNAKWADKYFGFSLDTSKSKTYDITPYVLHTDHLGAVIAATDTSGQVTWSAKYYPFGEIYDEQLGPDGLFVNLRRPGQYHDRETGLYYNMQRYYDPEIGRYITPDPVLNPTMPGNPYVYAMNNPVLAFDPDGEVPLVLPVLGAILVGLGYLWDAGSVGLSAMEVQQNPHCVLNWAALGFDAQALMNPFLPAGAGLAIKIRKGDDVLEKAFKWLGDKYTELGKKGSGSFFNKDLNHKFRMSVSDLLGHGTHNKSPHVHFTKTRTTSRGSVKETHKIDVKIDKYGRALEDVDIP